MTPSAFINEMWFEQYVSTIFSRERHVTYFLTFTLGFINSSIYY